jgi:hypothetical protein
MRSPWKSHPEWLALSLLLACEPSGAATGEAAAPPAAPFRALLQQPPTVERPCDGFAPPSIGGEIGLRIFLGADVATERARAALASLPSYFGAHGVGLRLVGPPRQLGAGPMLASGEPDQALAPLREFLKREATGPQRDSAAVVVNVVLLSRIADADSPARRYFTELEGLTLSPHLPPRGAELHRLLGLSQSFVPTILLSIEDIRRLPPGRVDLSAAHELGHALGLEHREGVDLMSPRPPRCVPPLREEQQAQVRRALTP